MPQDKLMLYLILFEQVRNQLNLTSKECNRVFDSHAVKEYVFDNYHQLDILDSESQLKIILQLISKNNGGETT